MIDGLIPSPPVEVGKGGDLHQPLRQANRTETVGFSQAMPIVRDGCACGQFREEVGDSFQVAFLPRLAAAEGDLPFAGKERLGKTGQNDGRIARQMSGEPG